MPGNLTLEDLKKAVKSGEIDTVIAAGIDMQGRLMGKRFTRSSSSTAAGKRRTAATTFSPWTWR